jgi:hypothetical protein
LTLTNFIFYPVIESLNIGDIYATDSQIGTIDTRSMKLLINSALKVAVPMINLLLAKGINFPQTLFGGKIVIENAIFNALQDYIKIELSPEFNF